MMQIFVTVFLAVVESILLVEVFGLDVLNAHNDALRGVGGGRKRAEQAETAMNKETFSNFSADTSLHRRRKEKRKLSDGKGAAHIMRTMDDLEDMPFSFEDPNKDILVALLMGDDEKSDDEKDIIDFWQRTLQSSIPPAPEPPKDTPSPTITTTSPPTMSPTDVLTQPPTPPTDFVLPTPNPTNSATTILPTTASPVSLPPSTPPPTTLTPMTSSPTTVQPITNAPTSEAPTLTPTLAPVQTTTDPTTQPTSFDFDLQDCQSYSLKWLIDLAETCVPIQQARQQQTFISTNFTDCECTTANDLFDRGIISCDEICPPNCVACESCFELRCDATTDPLPPPTSDEVESVAPTISPVVAELTRSPTESPVAINATEAPFDLQNCEAYQLTWIVDLATTCDRNDIINGNNLTGCECSTANELFDSGVISCEDDTCPDECIGCDVCYALRCDEAPPTLPPQSLDPSFTSVPTPSPVVVEFDLQQCDTYQTSWLVDLATTCSRNDIINGNITGCDCTSANELFDDGTLNCDIDQCPQSEDDSDVPPCLSCDICFHIICDTPFPELPTFNPPTQSPVPSATTTVAPVATTFVPTPTKTPTESITIPPDATSSPDFITNAPTTIDILTTTSVAPAGTDATPSPAIQVITTASPEPTSDTNNATDPILPDTDEDDDSDADDDERDTDAFDLSNCQSYFVSWLTDLAQTCDDPVNIPPYDGCVCTRANALFEDGTITCSDECPNNCDVCDACFELACSVDPASSTSDAPVPTSPPTPSNPYCDKWTWPECVTLTGEECQEIVEEDCPDLEQVQIIPDNVGVTADYRLDRVRIFVNEDNIVEEIPRVG